MVRSVRIVGAGLIGTSIGLALAAKNIAVEMIDVDSRSQALARDLTGASSVSDPELIILATPLKALSQVINEQYELNPNSTFMDVCSVKVEPLQKVQASKLPLKQFIGTHPMAGREVGGAESARADLFLSRSWIITPDAHSDPQALAKVKWLIQLLGATCVELDAVSHDAAVARVSHLPQITATLLASSLHGVDPDWLDLAGAGLRDTTRIAASDENLWKEIISSNSQEIKALLTNLHNELGAIIEALDDQEKIAAFMRKGRDGRNLIQVNMVEKHVNTPTFQLLSMINQVN